MINSAVFYFKCFLAITKAASALTFWALHSLSLSVASSTADFPFSISVFLNANSSVHSLVYLSKRAS